MSDSVSVSEYHEQYEFVAYVVQDIKSLAYSVPTFWRTCTDAVRHFESSYFSQFAIKQGLYFSHPHDFRLCAVGGFNSFDGVLSCEVPIVVADGFSVLRSLGLDTESFEES